MENNKIKKLESVSVEYKDASCLKDFEKVVNLMLTKGYQPHGSVTVLTDDKKAKRLIQFMTMS